MNSDPHDLPTTKMSTEPAPASSPENSTSDFFTDVANIRVDPTMAEGPSVAKVLVTVPIRKPSKEWFIRTNPDIDAYSVNALVLELKEESEIYLIPPSLRDALLGEACVHVKHLRLAVNRQGDPFVWPIRLPGSDGKIDTWNTSALEAADLGAKRWVRLSANRRLGAYDIAVADNSDEPRWPNMPFNELLRIAFKGKVIETMDHPVLRRLRGEA